MYIKVIAVICFVALASAADLTVGAKGGRVIFEQNVTASPAIWRQTKNVTVNASKSDEVISRVVVIDNRPEKNGEAKIVEGGAGDKNVTIELQGPSVLRGFDFSIQVFATLENKYEPDARYPSFIGVAGQNPKVPHSMDNNLKDPSKQVPKKENGDNAILGAPKPTATSTAATPNNGNQEKINNPALVGKEQTRLNRDTEGQKTKEHTLNTNKPAVEKNDEEGKKIIGDNWKKVIDSIFADNSTQKTQKSKPNEGKVQPVIPKDAHTDDDKRKARKTEEESVVPAVPKQLTGDKKHTTGGSIVPAVPKQLTGDEKHTTEKSVVPAVSKQLPGDEKHTTEESVVPAVPKQLPGDEKHTTEESVVPAVPKQLPGDEKHTTEKSVVPAVSKQLPGDEKHTTEESVVPAVPKQLTGDEKHTTEKSVVPAVSKQLPGDEKHTTEESVVPAVPKQLTGDEKHTTPKSNLLSTTAKNIGQEKYGPGVIPLSSEGKLTTESSKLPEIKTTQDLEKNLKDHHFEHPAAVPLPYHNH